MLNTPQVPYVPPAHLISESLPAILLTTMFEDFRSTPSSAKPECVFESIVAKLCDAFEQQRQQYLNELDSYRTTNETLEAELIELKRRVFGSGPEETSSISSNTYKHDTSKNPLPTLSPVATKPQRPNPVIGTFNTLDLRYWFQVRAQTSKIINFGRPYRAAPGLPLGLTTVDISKLANVRIKSYTSGIRDNCFEIHLDSWADTSLFSAACTWLEIEADDPDFQFGSYSTLNDQKPEQWQQQSSRQVVFARPYEAPPCVVVWLSGFDMRREKNWRVKAYPSDISATGFRIHIDTWEDTVLYSGTATWVAYTAGKPGVCSGAFTTAHGRIRKAHSGYESFEKGVFEKCPRTAVALNQIDMSCSSFMRLLVKSSEVSVRGMRWHLEGWLNTDVNSAGGSYIALS